MSLERFPYNFVSPMTSNGPWRHEHERSVASDGHHRWNLQRHSGFMRVVLETRTPTIIAGIGPDGVQPEHTTAQSPRRFVRIRDRQGVERFAIPGSSIKGALSTYFEAWTQSRLRFVGEDAGATLLYRRRSSDLWVVTQAFTNGDVRIRSARYELAFHRDGKWWRANPANRRTVVEVQHECPPPAAERPAADLEDTGWQVVRYRANLLWTPNYRTPGATPGEHFSEHRWTHLLVQLNSPGPGRELGISRNLVERYRKGLDVAAFEAHRDFVLQIQASGPGKSYYRDIGAEPLAQRVRELSDLSPGTPLFVLTTKVNHQPTAVTAFGKNVNFKWPALHTPRGLLEQLGMWPVAVNLASADLAQATFGFAGPEQEGGMSFRGRVAPFTFWASPDVVASPPVLVGPLIAPSGPKRKARRIYVLANKAGAGSYDDRDARPAGIKFAHHQGQARIVPPGDAQALGRDDGALQVNQWLETVPPLTRFEGRIDFTNLTEVELGALLVTLAPELLFRRLGAPVNTQFGIKLGLAKSSGLGSVKAVDLQLHSLHGARPAFSIAESPFSQRTEAERDALVDAFAQWLCRGAGVATPGAIALVADFRALTRLGGMARVFPDSENLADYDWVPEFNDPLGDPKGGRPPGLRPAREA